MSNEGVEKHFRDTAPGMHLLHECGIVFRKEMCCDGPLQANR